MKRYIAFAGLAFALLQGTMAQTIVKPSVKTKTTFAIVTDSMSYEEAKHEIDAYRASVENEGLALTSSSTIGRRPNRFVNCSSSFMPTGKLPSKGVYSWATSPCRWCVMPNTSARLSR